MIQGIFHLNVNVTNFERSLAFYQMLGFKVVADRYRPHRAQDEKPATGV